MLNNLFSVLVLIILITSCSAGGGSGSDSTGGSVTSELSCSNSSAFNADMSELMLTLNDCFFNDFTAGLPSGSINSTSNICTYSNKQITFSNPNYATWMSSIKSFIITKSGSSCLTLYYNPAVEFSISKDGQYLYKDTTTASGGTIVFKNRTWNINSSNLTGCSGLFNYFSHSTGTGGSPPATSSSISFGINYRKGSDSSIVTSGNSQPQFNCIF